MRILMVLKKNVETDPRVLKEMESLRSVGHTVDVTRSYIGADRYDAVHCHDLDTLFSGLLMKRKFGVKLIYDSHENYGFMASRVIPGIQHLIYLYEKPLLEQVDHIITVNDKLKEYFNRISDKPVTVVMNCTEKQPFIPPPTIFSVGYFGLLDESRMFPLILSIGDSFPFFIASRKERLYEEVKIISPLFKHVNFLGTLSYKEVIDVTKQCSVILCMTNPDDLNMSVATPTKIFEAMSCGRPVVVTEGTYPAEIVKKNECGLAVPYDVDDVLRACRELADEPSLYNHLSKRGWYASQEKYNWEEQSKKLLDVYENI